MFDKHQHRFLSAFYKLPCTVVTTKCWQFSLRASEVGPEAYMPAWLGGGGQWSVSECLCELLLPFMIRWLLMEPLPPVYKCRNAGLCCRAPYKIRRAIYQFSQFSVSLCDFMIFPIFLNLFYYFIIYQLILLFILLLLLHRMRQTQIQIYKYGV